MSDVAKVVTAQRYAQGFSYEGYLAQIGANQERFHENEAAFQLSPADAQFFQDFVRRLGPLKVLAVVEDWCPDVQRGLPVMARIAQVSGMELRIFPRDKNLDIMNLYLNQGKYMSIPVFAFFDNDLRPLCHWIERPVVATRFMEQVSSELAKLKLSDEEARQQRRQRMASMFDSWRQETIKELKELLSRVALKS